MFSRSLVLYLPVYRSVPFTHYMEYILFYIRCEFALRARHSVLGGGPELSFTALVKLCNCPRMLCRASGCYLLTILKVKVFICISCSVRLLFLSP